MSRTLPLKLLRLEGLTLLAGTLVLYAWTDASWWLIVLLFFAPDLSMIGYAAGPRVGAAIYNAAHSTTLALPVVVAGVVGDWSRVTALGLIWLAHIGFDRVLGYGLKYPEGFKETHLQRV